MFATYSVPRDAQQLWYGFAAIGLCHGVFALFTMYLPPLFLAVAYERRGILLQLWAHRGRHCTVAFDWLQKLATIV